MKVIKWILGIFVSLVIILAALVAIDISPYFALISTEQPTPQPYQTPSGVKIKLRSDIVSLTASEMARKIREKELSSVEVVEAHLSQIYQFNPQINAIVTLDAEGALQRAREADQALASGQLWGPLHGVPFTIKDHIATKSMRTTSGFGPLKDVVPDYDATVVARLKEAGGILLGKTNMPALGAASVTDNLIFGRTNNPWDLKRTVGGSSGGAAAALAAGMTPIEIGSDVGGSIRVPAHYNGVFGLKTTEHLLSFHGAMMPGIDQVVPEMRKFTTARHQAVLGPMARSIEDLHLLLSVIAGPDPNSVQTVDVPILYPKPKLLQNMKVAWTNNLPGEFAGQETSHISKDYASVLKGFLKRLDSAGLALVEKNLTAQYMNQARLTGFRLFSTEYEYFSPVTPLIMATLTNAPGVEYSVINHSYENYQRLLTERDRLRSLLDSFLKNYDALLVPVTMTEAYPLPEVKFDMGMADITTIITIDGKDYFNLAVDGASASLFNLTGHPVVVIPIGFTDEGIPVGIQVVGKRWRDAELLVVAQQLFEAAGEFKHPPGYMDSELVDNALQDRERLNTDSTLLKMRMSQVSSKDDLLVENANLIDGTEAPPRLVSIYIQNGKIVDIGKEIVVPSVKSIDVKGAYVLPGLIDSHVHLQWVPGSVYREDTPEKLRQFRFHQLRGYLASGVTSVLDTGISSQVLKEIHAHLNSGGIGPRVFALGPVFRAPNGYLGEQMRVPSWGPHWRAAETEEDIHQLFSEYEGIPDIVGVKLHLDFGWGPIDIWPIHKPEIRTIIERESKERKLPIYAHAQEERTRNIALEMGAHTLVHHVFSPEKDFIDRTKTQGTYLTTTLSNLERRLAYPNFLNVEEPLVTLTVPKEQIVTARDPNAWELFAKVTAQTSLFPSWMPTFISHFFGSILWLDPDPIEKFYHDESASVLEMYEAGIPITVGSDSGNLPHIVNMFHGPTTVREMELLEDAGIPPIEVLSSATRIPAKMMGVDHLIGTIEIGKQADLIVVGEDPTKDLSVLRNLLWVIKDGEARRPKEWMEQ